MGGGFPPIVGVLQLERPKGSPTEISVRGSDGGSGAIGQHLTGSSSIAGVIKIPGPQMTEFWGYLPFPCSRILSRKPLETQGKRKEITNPGPISNS